MIKTNFTKRENNTLDVNIQIEGISADELSKFINTLESRLIQLASMKEAGLKHSEDIVQPLHDALKAELNAILIQPQTANMAQR